VPFTSAFTRLTLGFQVLPERLWEWETCMLNVTSLPQKAHFAIYLHLLQRGSIQNRNSAMVPDLRRKCKYFLFFGPGRRRRRRKSQNAAFACVFAACVL
jgi:hypothetical protein